jgi:AcrR family transcriptional regulator
MRSVTRRRQNDNDETNTGAVEKLVEAFERLLSQGASLTTISVEKLAQEAGLARATFYLHFRNKGELVNHLMKNVAQELRTAAIRSLRKSESFGRAEFQTFMRDAVEIHFRHRLAIRAMVEISSYDADVEKSYRKFWQTQAADTRLVLKRLEAAGQAHPDAVPEIADLVTWTAERGCSQMLHDADSIERREQFADMLTHVVWNAIARPGY